MNDNPYSASTVDMEQADEIVVPEKVQKQIRNAWIAGTISGTITLAVVLFAMAGANILGFSAWQLIDVALIFALTFGIYRKSRVCAVVMLIYFIISKAMLITQAGSSTGIITALIFLYYYGYGVAGTFAYHKAMREQD
jgi:serine/threonine-protein kinase